MPEPSRGRGCFWIRHEMIVIIKKMSSPALLAHALPAVLVGAALTLSVGTVRQGFGS